MKPCSACGMRECTHRVPKDLQEELGMGEGDDLSKQELIRNPIEDYYAPSVKTVFVPVVVRYHDATDTIYSAKMGGDSIRIDRVEDAFKDNPARQKVLDEIKLYEAQLSWLENLSSISEDEKKHRGRNIFATKKIIGALKALANKF